MKDPLKITLDNSEKTALCGRSLAFSLYTTPVDVVLSGPVGAGKTTFVQGFAEALGIHEPVLSPTYALEQRYETDRDYPFLHLDLYRITDDRISEALAHSDAHEGVRCIEWADRMSESDDAGHGRISIALEEKGEGRICSIMFDDAEFPSYEEIKKWRKEVRLPKHIASHCDAVAAFAARCAKELIEKGIIVRPLLLQRAAEIHDLFRFVDFREGAAPNGHVDSPETIAVWETWKKKFPGMRHEQACATFLREKNFHALADIVEVHGLQLPSPERVTVEQQLLFYADKRVMIDTVVTLEERFRDFAQRYGNGLMSTDGKMWYEEAAEVEKLLFPQGVPL